LNFRRPYRAVPAGPTRASTLVGPGALQALPADGLTLGRPRSWGAIWRAAPPPPIVVDGLVAA